MKIKKIPTIIGIIVLTLGVGLAVFAVQYRQIFRLGASPEASAKNVRVTNVSDSQATVTWTTDRQNSGFVSWGENQNDLAKVSEDEVKLQSFTHTTTLRNLKRQGEYFFKINSGGILYDNNGTSWQFKTGPSITTPGNANLISGSVNMTSGAPAKNALVYVSVLGYNLSTITSENGSWVLSLSGARVVDLSKSLTIDPAKTLLEISVNAGSDGVASAQIYPQSAKPAPAIILGQVQDFRNLSPNKDNEVPKATLELGQVPTPQSGFAIAGESPAPSPRSVTLKSTSEGEVITSQKPEFFGSGPSGTTINIKVESEAQTTSLKVSTSGDWKWSPPSNLDPGAHKITLTWKDAGGITRTLTRNFIVQAAEGPAFVSTRSATPTQMATPTATFVATPTGTISASATPKPIDAGSLTPSILLTMMGIGALALSIFVWKRAEA